MRYILNSAVITSFGTYLYDPIDPDQVRDWIDNGPVESAIGYPETAAALSRITGLEIPVNRKQVKMQVGDAALVFRLKRRIDNPADKGSVGIEELLGASEFGILFCRESFF